MRKIQIEFPDDCTELNAIIYATGCFTPSQHDYKRVPKGFRNGEPLTFCDGRDAYYYKAMDGTYVLNLKKKS